MILDIDGYKVQHNVEYPINMDLLNLDLHLEQLIGLMDMFLSNPSMATPEEFGYRPLPVVRLGAKPLMSQTHLNQMAQVNMLLAKYRVREEAILALGEATKMIGQRVWKKGRKPFKCGERIVTVKGIINHPFTNRLAFVFSDDDSYVEVRTCEAVKKNG